MLVGFFFFIHHLFMYMISILMHILCSSMLTLISLWTGTDSQKQLAGTSVVGEANLHQPVGLPPAIHAASVMAGVLGGAQTANVQNGLPVQYGLGNDPLTHYLARMSRHQLHEVMAELKVNS
jgi:cleavage stimulation factor subunit 2